MKTSVPAFRVLIVFAVLLYGVGSAWCGNNVDVDGSQQSPYDESNQPTQGLFGPIDSLTCGECGCFRNTTWGVDAPDVLPSLGKKVKLVQVALGGGEGVHWGTHIGFGPYRTLSCLSKVRLVSDRSLAGVFYPASGEVVTLVQDDQDPSLYVPLVDDGQVTQRLCPASVRLQFTDSDGDGKYDYCVYSFPDGRSWKYEFSETNTRILSGDIFRVAEETDRHGYKVAIAYAANSITIKDASGTEYVCTVDGNDLITEIAVAGRSWTYDYSTPNTVVEINNQTGKETLMATDNKHRVTEFTESNPSDLTSNSESYVYDAGGRLTEKTHNGIVMTFTQIEADNVLTEEWSEGGLQKRRKYSKHGMTENSVGGEGDTWGLARTGRRELRKDALDKEWITTQNEDGFTTCTKDPDGVEVSYEYDDQYNLTKRITADGVWDYTYDSHNLMLTETGPLGVESRYVRYPWTYDADGDGVVEEDELHPWRGLVRYQLEKVSGTPEQWRATYYTYNRLGQVTSRKGPYFCAIPTADWQNQDFAAGMPAEGMTYLYDAYGNRTNVVDENGNSTTYTYNGFNKVSTVTRNTGTANLTTRYTYDGLGRKITQEDPEGHTTLWHRDTRGFVVAITGFGAAGSGCSGCGEAASAGGTPGLYFYDDSGLLEKFVDMKQAKADGFDPSPDNFDPNVLEQHRDADGITHEYNAFGQRTKTIDARSYETAFGYDDAGRQTSVRDPNGVGQDIEYTAAGRIDTVTTTRGEETKYTYDNMGRQTTVTSSGRGTVTTHYDALGRVDWTTDAAGILTEYGYDLVGNQTSMVHGKGSPEEVTTLTYYDAEGHPIRTEFDPTGLNRVTKNVYDAGGRLIRSIVDPDDPDGLKLMTAYDYDGANRMTHVIRDPWDRDPSNPGKEDPDALNLVTEYEYDGNDRRIRVTTAGRFVHTPYDGSGRLDYTDDGVTKTDYCYDDAGNRICVSVDGRSPISSYYDERNLLAYTEQDDGTSVIRIGYIRDMGGRVTMQGYWTDIDADDVVEANELTSTTSYQYEPGSNLPLIVTNGEGEETVYRYDAAGRRELTTMANGSYRKNTFDEAGRLVSTEGGPEGKTVYEYDGVGRQYLVTDANGRSRQTFYNKAGEVLRVENEMDQPVVYVYDKAGRRESLTDAENNTTTYEYDDASRLAKMTYPAVDGQPVNEELYAHDAGDLLVTKTTPNGDNIGYAYNPAGSLSTVTFGGTTVEYGRDVAGAVTSITGLGHVEYDYNGLGQMTHARDKTHGGTHELVYAYDPRGLRSTMTLGAGVHVVQYRYDNALRLKEVEQPNITSIEGQNRYAYDLGGRRSNLDLANGVRTAYSYTGADQLAALETQNSDGTIASFRYTLDPVGNRTAIEQEKYMVYYKFDQAYRLTQETRIRKEDGTLVFEETFSYDKVGNRETRNTKRYEPEPQPEVPVAIWPLDEQTDKPYALAAAAFVADGNTLALYHLEESDTVLDSSSNGNDGTLQGPLETHATGKFTDGVTFLPPVGEEIGQISVADSPSLALGASDFTLEAWVNTASEGRQTLLSKANADGTVAYSLSLQGLTPVLVLTLEQDPEAEPEELRLVGETQVPAGAWAHLSNSLDDGIAMDAIVITTFLEMERWNIGISYDVTTSVLKNANNSRGAFEMSFIYVQPSRSRYSVRCPNF